MDSTLSTIDYMTNNEIQGDLKYSSSVGNYSTLTGYGVGSKLTDVESNLKLLNFPLTNNPSKKYSSDKSEKALNIFKEDGFFNSEYVSQVNNPLDLKEQGINRFQFLHLDPQKNVIEPFPRLGNNTVLETLDNHKTFC
tara:strand:+ start:641 stop:1054 length:414 start_codon:yes stop_codon:yes gene_type:complete